MARDPLHWLCAELRFLLKRVSALEKELAERPQKLKLVDLVLQVQSIDRCVDEPVQKQRQVPMVQKVQNTVEFPQIPCIDRDVDVPVQKQRQVPMIQKVHKTVESSQIQYIGKIVDVPAQMQTQVPMIQKVQKTDDEQCEYDDIETLAIDVPPPDDGEEHLPCYATNKNPDSWMFDVSHSLEHMQEKIANLTKDIINLKNESNTKLDTKVDDFSRTQILMIVDIAKQLFESTSEKFMEKIMKALAITIFDEVKKYVDEAMDERMADLKKYVKDSDWDLYGRIMEIRGDLHDIILNDGGFS